MVGGGPCGAGALFFPFAEVSLAPSTLGQEHLFAVTLIKLAHIYKLKYSETQKSGMTDIHHCNPLRSC